MKDHEKNPVWIYVQLNETGQGIAHFAVNSYTKGPLFCIYDGEKVYKYPVANIWRIVEDYGVHP